MNGSWPVGPLLAGGVAFGALTGIWLGYPAWMWCRARWRPRPMRPDAQAGATRRVTVILATRASARAVEARVRNLLDSAHPGDRLQVMVAVDGDPAPVAAAVAGLGQRVQVVGADAPGGKAAALNAGVRAADADVFVFADTAQRFDERTIPELVAALEDPAFGAVSGVLVLPRDASPLRLYWAMEAHLRRQEALVHASIGVTGAVYAMRATLWSPLPPGTILDDVYAPMRLVLDGWRVGVAPRALAWDERSFDAGAEVVRKTRTQTGVLQLLHLLPALRSSANPVRGAFFMHKLARLTTPLWLLVLVLAGVLVTASTLTGPLAAVPASTWLAGGVVLVVLARTPMGRRLATLLGYGMSLQWALIRALVFGSRGRWAVWDPVPSTAPPLQQSTAADQPTRPSKT